MKARYHNNKDKGPGHGFLQIAGLPDSSTMEGLSFVITRASDRKHLGPSGWQPAESSSVPDSVSLGGDDGYCLGVGPAIVDSLDPRETYRLTLRLADGNTISGGLLVEEVAYSAIQGGQGIAAGMAAEVALAAKPESPVEPEPAEPEAVAGADAEPLPGIVPETEPTPPARSGLPVIIFVLLLLAAAALAAWKFLLHRDVGEAIEAGLHNATVQSNATGQTPANATVRARHAADATETDAAGKNATAVSRPEAGGQTSGTERDSPSPDQHAAEPAKSPLTRARTLLEGPADPTASLSLAQELEKERDGADAAFLLAEDAAQKGNAEAMLLTARFYDPTDKQPTGSIIKDPEQALSWYKKAQTAGHAEAAGKLTALRAWAEAQAAKGDVAAKELLNRF